MVYWYCEHCHGQAVIQSGSFGVVKADDLNNLSVLEIINEVTLDGHTSVVGRAVRCNAGECTNQCACTSHTH